MKNIFITIAIYLFLILSINQYSFAQDKINIEGIIYGKAISDLIQSAHIYSEKYGTGTISNENGEFSMSIPNAKFPLELIISHISYQTKAVIVSEAKHIVLAHLERNSIILEEVLVGAKVKKIAEDVMEILSNEDRKYGRAFYRQFTTVGNTVSEFSESFYKIAYGKSGIKELKIEQARYARRNEGDFLFTNFPFLTFGFPIVLEKSSKIKIPFSPDFNKYRFVIENKFKKDNEEYVEIKCIPSVKTMPSDSSEVWLNASFTFNLTENYLLDYRATVNHGLGAEELRSFTEDSLSVSNPSYSWYYSFSGTEKNEINYILCEYIFDLRVNDVVKNSIVSSKTVLYEKNERKFRRLNKPSLELEDLKSVSNVRYKKRFWKDNPVIKLTDKEEKIIQTFEEENAFGTYFK